VGTELSSVSADSSPVRAQGAVQCIRFAHIPPRRECARIDASGRGRGDEGGGVRQGVSILNHFGAGPPRGLVRAAVGCDGGQASAVSSSDRRFESGADGNLRNGEKRAGTKNSLGITSVLDWRGMLRNRLRPGNRKNMYRRHHDVARCSECP
jgi:hypothetical protein